MIPSGAGSSSCFPNLLSPQILKMYAVPADDVVSSSAINPSVELSQLNSLFYNASILKDKIHQVQSMATILLSTDHHHPPPYEHHDHDHDHHQTHQHFSIAMANMSSVVQEIIVAASSMMFTCQQVNISAGNNAGASTVSNDTNNINASTGLFLQNKSPLHNQSSPDNHHPSFDRVGDVISPDGGGQSQSFYSGNSFEWFGSTTAAAAAATHDHNNYYVNPSNPNHDHANGSMLTGNETGVEVIRREFSHGVSSISGVSSWNTRNSNNNNSSSSNRNRSNNNKNNYDIIELDPEELLAKYTHYCQVCGKGFKRDANLRMHMRAHGDEYKSNAALTNPMKNSNQNLANSMYMGSNNNNLDKNCENPSPTSTKYPKKYSCPQEGCRWNKKHANFQPLKSIICVKNHYKRSHCPKMYVCKRCNRKQFSVLSDLRTHEKHCGELKWQCSCGTTFSRKDKLMGHVALFVGHTPAVNVGGRSSTRVGNLVLNNHQQQVVQML